MFHQSSSFCRHSLHRRVIPLIFDINLANLPAFEELVVDGTNGFVFRSEDPISLAHKLKDIILRREHLEEITEMAYTNLEKDYGWEKIGLELRNTYYRIYEK